MQVLHCIFLPKLEALPNVNIKSQESETPFNSYIFYSITIVVQTVELNK